MTDPKVMADKIAAYLKAQDWTYEYDSLNGVFSVAAELNCKLDLALVLFQIQEDGFFCYTTIDQTADDRVKATVGEYLHRANYGLPRGCFEFDYDDGSIHFKTFFPCGPEGPTDQQLEDSLTIGLSVMDRYGNGLAQLLTSPSKASELILQAESEG